MGYKYHLGYMIGCLGEKGMTYCTQVNSDYFINHDIRIPFQNNQDSMESNKFVVFSWLNYVQVL